MDNRTPTLAQTERAALADLFDVVGPNAPTLCEGWDTQDLCEHLVARESDPVALPGMFIPPLAGVTRRRMDRLGHRGNWTQLVDRFRQGPPRWTPMGLPRVDAAANGLEFFIHHEDVRRAGQEPMPPRPLKLTDEEALWGRVGMLARLAFRKAPVGVVVENAVDPEGSLRVKGGATTVTMTGKPSELALWLYGRREVAEVEFIGEEEAVADLLQPFS